MDAMRSVLMMLGVFLHSSLVFEQNSDWLIRSNQTTPVADILSNAIHTFRMPAFFIVSGFFCVFTLRRYGADQFFKLRLVRILIPLIVTAITLNSIQTYLLVHTGWRVFSLPEYLQQGRWVSHLWFLINLVYYFAGAYVLAKLAAGPLLSLNALVRRILMSMPISISLAVFPLVLTALLSLNKLGFPLYYESYGLIDVFSLVYYLPFFAFGAVIGTDQELLFRFSDVNPLVSSGVIVSAILAQKLMHFPGGLLGAFDEVYLHELVVWYSAALCFYFFYRFCNSASPLFTFFR